MPAWCPPLKRYTRWFARDCRGQIALAFALSLPVLLGSAALAVDMFRFHGAKARLQGLADSAAVAAAKGLQVANSSARTAQAAAGSYVQQAAVDMAHQGGDVDISVSTKVDEANSSVTVALTHDWHPIIAQTIADMETPVTVTATAQLVGTEKICVLGTMPKLFAAVHLMGNARLVADNCGVHSNSDASSSIRVDSGAVMKARSVCAAGGVWAQSSASITPSPTLDCPVLDDPLAERVPPPVTSCDYTDTVVSTSTTLSPGRYCGGLVIAAGGDVKLRPGVYYIDGGPLVVEDGGTMDGEGAGFYLSGEASTFRFEPASSISLSAPVDGPMAGLLVYEDRNVSELRLHTIRSNNARKLIGTIYVPKGLLLIAANAPVADQSAYTAIVSRRLMLDEGPTLVLNADYSATQVPVPAGLTGRVVVTR